jgi:hypothetical protein
MLISALRAREQSLSPCSLATVDFSRPVGEIATRHKKRSADHDDDAAVNNENNN